MNRKKTHVKKGDVVQVTSGNHKGAEGKVLQVNVAKSQVLVEGVRLIKKTVKKSQDHPNGAIIEREGPIHISNVKLLERTTTKEGAKASNEVVKKTSKPKKSED